MATRPTRVAGPAAFAGLLIAMAIWSCESQPTLTGLWVGGFTQVDQERSGTIRLELSQLGADVSGRWTITVDTDLSWSGRLEGTVDGARVDARLIPDAPDVCPYSWSASRTRDRLAGNYEAYDCRVVIVGAIDTRRQ